MGLSLMEQKAQEWEVTGRYPIDARSVNPYNSSFETLVKDLKRWKREKYGIILMCASGTRAKRLAADLQEEELNSFYSEDPERVVKPTGDHGGSRKSPPGLRVSHDPVCGAV